MSLWVVNYAVFYIMELGRIGTDTGIWEATCEGRESDPTYVGGPVSVLASGKCIADGLNLKSTVIIVILNDYSCILMSSSMDIN